MHIKPNNPIKISILSTPSHLPVVRAAAEKFCELIGFSEDAAGNIVLSLDEAMTNIIRHAYDGAADKPIEIELESFESDHKAGVCIRLRDFGKCVDRSKIKSRDLADVRPGGLGVHIITKCMDSVEYTPAHGGGTTLTMIKALQEAETK